MTLNRRQFIHTTAAAGLALSGVPFIHAAQKAKQYRTALIGSGWWGMNILKEAMTGGRCKTVALCDVDQNALELAAEEVTDLSGDTPKTYGDFRELL
ncbi:MAG: gfo/Idh/MocA family oxidoreductase, partial [Planctomycetia bacterium]|nr:gfo/Idh/MocA family oxidoreductase [Planctomycetia bacterium]